MLMEPVGGWFEQAAGPPVDANARLSFFPEIRIALARQDENVSAGAVSVSPRIGSYGILFEVSAHGIGGKVKTDSRCAFTSGTAVFELQIPHIGNEVRFPRAMAFDLFALAAEITVIAAESVVENKLTIENEIQIAEAIDHQGRVGHGNVTGWTIALHVKVLMPGVERRRKEAPFLPFESLFMTFFVPNRRGAASFHDVNELFEEITLRQAALFRRDFRDVNIASASGADEINEAPEHAFASPGSHGDAAEIFDTMAAHDGYSFAFLPELVGRFI